MSTLSTPHPDEYLLDYDNEKPIAGSEQPVAMQTTSDKNGNSVDTPKPKPTNPFANASWSTKIDIEKAPAKPRSSKFRHSFKNNSNRGKARQDRTSFVSKRPYQRSIPKYHTRAKQYQQSPHHSQSNPSLGSSAQACFAVEGCANAAPPAIHSPININVPAYVKTASPKNACEWIATGYFHSGSADCARGVCLCASKILNSFQ